MEYRRCFLIRELAWRALVGALLTVVVLAVAGAANAAPSKVDPAVYVTTVCNAIATLHNDTVAAGQPVIQATQAYKAAPSGQAAQQLRDSFVNLLRQSKVSMTNVEGSTRAAGIPNVARGSKFAQAVLRYERITSQKLDTLAARAASIPVSEATTFGHNYSKLLAAVKGTGASMRTMVNRDPIMSHAPAVLGPLAAYFKTSADTCTAT